MLYDLVDKCIVSELLICSKDCDTEFRKEKSILLLLLQFIIFEESYRKPDIKTILSLTARVSAGVIIKFFKINFKKCN
jgi:hypothetical protein